MCCLVSESQFTVDGRLCADFAPGPNAILFSLPQSKASRKERNARGGDNIGDQSKYSYHPSRLSMQRRICTAQDRV